MDDVFLSYAREDTGVIRRLFHALQEKQLEPWVDWEDIPLSSDWWQEIQAGIVSADTFVFVMSHNSLVSRVCNSELAYAISFNKRIVPVVIDEVDEPTLAGERLAVEWEQSARENWEFLKQLNWVFCRESDDFERAVAELVETINRNKPHIKLHTQLLNRALGWQNSGGSSDFLLRGDELTVAQNWLVNAGDTEPLPSGTHRAYVMNSVTHYTTVTLRRFRLMQTISLVTIMGLVGIIILFFVQNRVDGTSTETLMMIAAVASVLVVVLSFMSVWFSFRSIAGVSGATAQIGPLLDGEFQINVEEHHIFISYSRVDAAVMANLKQTLQSKGLKTWTDEHLDVGTPEWEREIEDAIKEAGCLAVVLSPDANQSKWVRRELSYAETFAVKIFPILASGDVGSSVPIQVIDRQHIDGRDNFAEGCKQLTAAVMEHLATFQSQPDTV